jgi:hypothetical protein
MRKLAGCRRGRTPEISLLGQQNLQAAAGRIARDACAVDAATNDEEIDFEPGHRLILAQAYPALAGSSLSRNAEV